MASPKGEAVPLVILPRYSTFFGPNVFTTVPLDVTGYSKAFVTVWRKGTYSHANFQGSHDAASWFDIGSTITGDGDDFYELDLGRRWLRFRAELTADDHLFVGWATGLLERRVTGAGSAS